LDARSVLVQYALGSPRSFAWVVTRDSVDLVTLADRKTIEDVARRAHDYLKTYQPDRPRAELTALLGDLSSLILAPIAPLLEAKDRVIVAADGALAYVPFAIMAIARDGATMPMLEAFEIVRVPSMSAMAAQRRRAEAGPSKTLAVFADPVFTPTDPRLPRSDVRAPLPAQPSGGISLNRLPATSAEAGAIAALVPENSRLVATGFAATRERVMNTPLADYRIIHFATHGLVDSRYPGLSALALSQFDASGQTQNGLLRLQDIYALRLNADLVVLSGCDTALGREIRGEGLIGLADAFLYAGARSLVVSLWQVPDRATAELMTRFYAYVLTDRLRPAEALRRAQRSIAAERRWSDPYFWGAFVVLGDS
jgi:CHAT domain-containing protein